MAAGLPSVVISHARRLRLKVPDDELAGFTALLEKSQYAYRDESQNPAYDLFLA